MCIVDSTVEIYRQDGMCRYFTFHKYSALINRNRSVESGSPLGVVMSTNMNSLLNVSD